VLLCDTCVKKRVEGRDREGMPGRTRNQRARQKCVELMHAANAAKRRAASCVSSGDGSSGIDTEDNEMKGEACQGNNTL
jgi:hypothetical protein